MNPTTEPRFFRLSNGGLLNANRITRTIPYTAERTGEARLLVFLGAERIELCGADAEQVGAWLAPQVIEEVQACS